MVTNKMYFAYTSNKYKLVIVILVFLGVI